MRYERGLWRVIVVAGLYGCGSSGETGTAQQAGGAGGTSNAGSGGAQGGAPATGGTDQQTPAVPEPTVDCAMHTGNYCFSLAGRLDGDAFDVACLVDTGGLRVKFELAGQTDWTMNCAADGFSAHLSFPAQEEGTFELDLTGEEAPSGANLRVTRTADNKGGSVTGPSGVNIEQAFVTGTVGAAGGDGEHDLVSGAFEGTWSEPEGCQICAKIELRGTFRALYDF